MSFDKHKNNKATEEIQIHDTIPVETPTGQQPDLLPGFSTLVHSLLQPHDSNYERYSSDCNIGPELSDAIHWQPPQGKENDPNSTNQYNNLEALAEIAGKFYEQSNQEKPQKKQIWEFEDWQPIRNLRRERSARPYPTQRPPRKEKPVDKSRNYLCPICLKSFDSYKLLFDDLKTHDNGNHQCHYCLLRLSCKHAFCNHILNKHNQNSFFKCTNPECQAMFKTLTGYQKHQCPSYP